MPWKVAKTEDGYYVVNIQTGKRMSRRPLSDVRAHAQLRALYANNPEAVKELVTLKRIGRRRDVSKADKRSAVGKYGNVTYADPVNKKYPIDTPAHIRAAWSYIHMPKNAAKYGGTGGIGAVQEAIRAAFTSTFGHPPGAKNISSRRRKEFSFKGRGYMPGLAKHLAHKFGGDPNFFTKVVESEELSGYDEEARNAIAARAHKIAIGHWPAEDKKFERRKEAAPTIRNILEGKIHSAFTLAADQLFQRGYMDRDTRIALSGLIGDVLEEFGERFATTDQDGPVDPEDANEIAMKEVSATPTGVPAHGPGGLFSSPGLGGAVPPARRKKRKVLTAVTVKENGETSSIKGGEGSGNWGHRGRPGIRGGSGSGGSGKFAGYDPHAGLTVLNYARSDYPAHTRTLAQNVAENKDYQVHHSTLLPEGGYAVTLNSGAYAVSSLRRDAIKKAQAQQHRRDVTGAMHQGAVPSDEVLSELEYTPDEWRKLRESGYYSAEVIGKVTPALRRIRRARREAKKEQGPLRQIQGELYAAQRREHTRLKEGDASAKDRLRALRLECRDIERELAEPDDEARGA